MTTKTARPAERIRTARPGRVGLGTGSGFGRVRRELLEKDSRSREDRAGLGEALVRSAEARRLAGDVAGAPDTTRRSVDAFRAVAVHRPDSDFFEGCARAMLAGLAGRAGSGVPAADEGPEAEAAVGMLRLAARGGYRDPAAYRTESALDPLRGREDFRRLMMDLAMPADPFVPIR